MPDLITFTGHGLDVTTFPGGGPGGPGGGPGGPAAARADRRARRPGRRWSGPAGGAAVLSAEEAG